MKILVIGKGKIGNLINNYLLDKFKDNKKNIIDHVSLDKEILNKKGYDYIIDFSHPESIKHYKKYLHENTKIIIGTTGFKEDDKEYIEFLSKMNPIVMDSNFSKGIVVLSELLENIKKYKREYTVKLIEKHHLDKKDKPSGTAIKLALPFGNIPIESKRVECKNSTHELILENELEKIVISHEAIDPKVYLKGIDESLEYLNKQKNGLFTYKDVLNGCSKVIK